MEAPGQQGDIFMPYEQFSYLYIISAAIDCISEGTRDTKAVVAVTVLLWLLFLLLAA